VIAQAVVGDVVVLTRSNPAIPGLFVGAVVNALGRHTLVPSLDRKAAPGG